MLNSMASTKTLIDLLDFEISYLKVANISDFGNFQVQFKNISRGQTISSRGSLERLDSLLLESKGRLSAGELLLERDPNEKKICLF